MASPFSVGAFPDGSNREPKKNEENFNRWFFVGDNPTDIINALNNFSFKSNQFEGTFVRLEKSPAHVYGVVINQGGQHEHPFWKELNRLKLKLVKVGFTQQETIKGTGNRMEIVQKRIKSELGFGSSTIFCLIIDLTTTASFREVEEDIRSKIGIKLDKDFAKELKLPIPTEWVLTSQEIINIFTNRIKEKKKKCIKDRTMYTTKDIELEPRELQRIEKLLKEISLSYVRLIEIVMSAEKVLVESFKKTSI